MNIEWNKVTRYSQIIAIVLFVGVFVLGFCLGRAYEYHAFVNALPVFTAAPTSLGEKPIADVTYSCSKEKTVHAIYRKQEVELLLSDGRHLTVPQAISGSGARYANADESFVFWNKGNTAFITEGNDTTYADCTEMNAQ
ncbi:MAG: MliC family protein [Bacillota bacterium]